MPQGKCETSRSNIGGRSRAAEQKDRVGTSNQETAGSKSGVRDTPSQSHEPPGLSRRDKPAGSCYVAGPVRCWAIRAASVALATSIAL